MILRKTKLRQTLFFSFAVCLISFSACKNRPEKKPVASEKVEQNLLPNELAKAYQVDAARLAAREFNTTTTSQDPQVQLPKERVKYFYELLTKVYLKAQSDPEIPDLSNIHTRSQPGLNSVAVWLEKDAPFKDNWLEGSRLTRNMYLNQVFSNNRLRLDGCKDNRGETRCTISSATHINTKDLSYIMRNIDGISAAEPLAESVGDGNRIEYGSEGKNHMAIKFSIGDGDCPSGCIQRKYWIFYIQEDGNINYMGSRGEVSQETEDRIFGGE